jgi:hypothetical protein
MPDRRWNRTDDQARRWAATEEPGLEAHRGKRQAQWLDTRAVEA